MISFALFIWFATAIPSIMMTRSSSVVPPSSSIWCRMDDLSVQLRGCPSLKIVLLVPRKVQNVQVLLLNWARAVFVLLSRILLVGFSPHATVQLCCQLFFNHLVVYFKRFQITFLHWRPNRYISAESIRNKILMSGMSNAGMINNFCCKQRW